MGVNTPYFMCDEVKDPKAENRVVPNREATKHDLAKINVDILKLTSDEEWEVQVDKLCKVYEMNFRDEVTINREKMKDFNDKMKIFFSEHLHKDPELRIVKAGSGYFDVRSADDKWIRIPVTKGDFVYLPSGIYHRFTTDKKEDIIAVRLFASNPRWTAYNRDADGDKQEERKRYLLKNALIKEQEAN